MRQVVGCGISGSGDSKWRRVGSPHGAMSSFVLERGALLVLLVGQVPVGPAVAFGHVALGAGDDDGVAAEGLVEEPLAVGQAHADAAVADVGAALAAARPRGAVDELAGAG